MACPENVIPYIFKPGQCGNPNGRPKGRKSISTYLKMFVEGGLDKLPNEKLREQLRAQGFDCVAAAMAFKKLSLALSSTVKQDTQLRAMDSIEDRLEGKATQKTELTGAEGGALLVNNATYEESLKNLTVEELEEYQKLLTQANNILTQSKERELIADNIAENGITNYDNSALEQNTELSNPENFINVKSDVVVISADEIK